MPRRKQQQEAKPKRDLPGRRAEDALYRSVVEDQSEYIVRWRPDGIRTFVNEAYCRYRRATPEELIGEHFLDLIAEVDRDRVARKLDLLTPENPTFTGSHRSESPDGSLRWQEWSDRGIFDESGQLIEVQSVGRDITERLRIERELEAREHQYEAVFRASVDGLTVRRLEDGKLLQANPAMAEMFGYTVEEFMELEPKDYVRSDFLVLYGEMAEAMRRGERFPFEVTGIHRDGSSLDLEGHFIPLHFEGENQILGLVRDVTERKRAARSLSESERRFRALFEAALDAIFVSSVEGEVLDANPAACRLHGLDRRELIGCHLSELVPRSERQEALEGFRRVAEGEGLQLEGVVCGPDGAHVPVSVRATRFDYSGEPALLYHVTDVTERRLLEDQLRQAHKMEAVGQLAGGVAHDFNNLLTAILGYAEIVEGHFDPDQGAREDVGEIRRAGEKAARLVAQLLAFSRQQVLKPEVLDLNEVVVEMEKLCRRTIGENVNWSIRLDPDLGLTRADQGQIEQVILNLAINARDAMPSGGNLLFETENLILEERHAGHHVSVGPGTYVALTVSDTGCGMSEEVRSRVFEPFFTTKNSEQGTGLGLSMVYGIVKQSGGFIWVYSEPDRGTTFKILLPQIESKAGDATPEVKAVPLQTEGKTILLVEDSAAVRGVAERTLSEHGHEVASTGSAEEALELSRVRPGGFDLLVTDFVLPKMDGLALSRKILAGSPETRVILMSGYSKMVGLGDLPVDEFLQKPFVRKGLLEAVAKALASGHESSRPLGVLAEAD